MAELGEFHRRRILVTFQHIEKLLHQSLSVLARAQSDMQRNLHDISPSKRIQIENQIKLIRGRMHKFLERSRIDLPVSSKPSSWILKTNMTSIEIALDDLYPQKMKGYGEMDSAVSAELTQTLDEIRKHLTLLLQALNRD